MKNIAKTAHHHEETPHDNALQNVKKRRTFEVLPVTDGKDLSSVCVHIPEHTRSFNRQAYTNLKISTVR